jgi:hypothetical protein
MGNNVDDIMFLDYKAFLLKNIKIPPVMEFTFYRKDRAEIDINKKLVFPHPLDNDNLPHLQV